MKILIHRIYRVKIIHAIYWKLRPAIRAIYRFTLRRRMGNATHYQPLPWIGYNKSTRNAASKARWEMMKTALPESPFSALDVGSNVGYFSFRLAESGGFVIGVEQVRSLVRCATRIRDYTRIKGCAFTEFSLTTETVEGVGSFDVILMLSVFHNMAHFLGFKDAKKILTALISKTRNVMFFETAESDGSGTGYAASMPDMGVDHDAWIECLLRDCGAKQVKLLGKVPVIDGASSLRSIFAVYR